MRAESYRILETLFALSESRRGHWRLGGWRLDASGILERLWLSSGGSGQGPWGFFGNAGSVSETSWKGLGRSSVGLWGLEGPLELWEAFWKIIGGVPELRFSVTKLCL